MKSTILRLSLVFAVLLGGATALAQDEPPLPVFGAVNIISPDLYMTPAGGGDEARIVVPSSVFEAGEVLRTDDAGVALITWFYDGTESVLGQGSTLALHSFSGEADDFVLNMELQVGHLVSGVGYIADDGGGEYLLQTPAFDIVPLRGQFAVTVADDGSTTLVVTEGRVEVNVADASFTVDENQYVVDDPAMPMTLSDDGMTVNLDGCKTTTNTNVNVRLAPNEDSRRLARALSGQELWVRAATEGNLWFQVYVQTAEDDEEGHNYGWVYGPATTTNDACEVVLRAALDSRLYGGPGIDNALGAVGESDPLEE